MASAELVLFRCGNGACQHRLPIPLVRSRGLSFSLVEREAERRGWVLGMVQVQYELQGQLRNVLAVDVRCPACGAAVPSLAAPAPTAQPAAPEEPPLALPDPSILPKLPIEVRRA